ncbi:hypothetical protein BH24ACT9_BH24ACT9_16660 [soil metagenome]
MKKRPLGVGAVAVIIALAALVTTLATTSQAEPNRPTADQAVDLWPPLAETFTFNDIVTTPVPDDLVGRAVVTSEEAIAAAENNGFPKDMRPGEPEVALRIATFDLGGGIPDPNGEASGAYYDRLTWVVIYHDSAPDIHGPAPADGAATDRPEMSCIMLFVVDAVDGSGVFDVRQLCRDI